MSNRPSSSTTSAHPFTPTPHVPSQIHALSNPPPALIDAQLPSYLLPQALSLLHESASHVVRKRRKREDELRAEGLLPASTSNKGKGKAVEGEGAGQERDEEERKLVEEEVRARLERMGLMVGGYIAEKLTLARPPLASHLDIIKFICKDLFLYVYSKQIDNLRTNHRGTFVLQSHGFPPLTSLSSYKGPAADMELAKQHLIFPQALIQGALARLGMPAFVTAESSGLPQCTFQIRTVKSTQLPPTPSAGTPGQQGTPGAGGVGVGGARSPAPPQHPPASTGLGIANAPPA